MNFLDCISSSPVRTARRPTKGRHKSIGKGRAEILGPTQTKRDGCKTVSFPFICLSGMGRQVYPSITGNPHARPAHSTALLYAALMPLSAERTRWNVVYDTNVRHISMCGISRIVRRSFIGICSLIQGLSCVRGQCCRPAVLPSPPSYVSGSYYARSRPPNRKLLKHSCRHVAES